MRPRQELEARSPEKATGAFFCYRLPGIGCRRVAGPERSPRVEGTTLTLWSPKVWKSNRTPHCGEGYEQLTALTQVKEAWLRATGLRTEIYTGGSAEKGQVRARRGSSVIPTESSVVGLRHRKWKNGV